MFFEIRLSPGKAEVVLVEVVLGGRTRAPPDTPVYVGGVRHPFFNRNPINKAIRREAGGRH